MLRCEAARARSRIRRTGILVVRFGPSLPGRSQSMIFSARSVGKKLTLSHS